MKITGADIKKYIAEMIGTMVLVVLGCGVAQATGCEGNAGIIATSLAFGFVIVAMAYSIGNISGCHINTAVSLGLLVSKNLILAAKPSSPITTFLAVFFFFSVRIP